MDENKLAILIVPGAWHKPTHYATFSQLARENRFEAQVVDLPSMSEDLTDHDFERDVKQVSQQLACLLAQNRRVIVVAHSYGGLPTCEAVPDPRDITTGQLVAIFFVAAIIPTPGMTMREIMGGQFPSFIQFEQHQCMALEAQDVFYNQLPKSVGSRLANDLVPMSMSTFDTPVHSSAWVQHKCCYIRCGQDNAVPIITQDANTDKLASMKVLDLPDSDHLPFESSPRELLRLIASVIS